jgi:hypothetical protein
MLTPGLAGALVLGIASLGEVRDLADWGAWRDPIAFCRSVQAEHYRLDQERARADLIRAVESAGRSLRRTPDGALVTGIELGGGLLPLRIVLERQVVTVSLAMPGLDVEMSRESLLAMLKQNLTTHTAKLGLDAGDELVLSYQVPRVERDLLANVEREFSRILEF